MGKVFKMNLKKLCAFEPEMQGGEKHETYGMTYTMEECDAHMSKLHEWYKTSIFGFVKCNFYYPIYRFFANKRWRDIRYWFKPANVLKVERHTRWTIFDKPNLMYHANFQILNSFFSEEKEWIDNFIKTSWTEEEIKESIGGEELARKQNDNWQKLKDLHEWYNSHTNEQISNMLDGYPPDHDYEINGISDYDIKWYYFAENQLMELVKLRGMLWT